MVDHSWTVDSIRPFVLHAIRVFGTHRSMFATNFPVDKLYSDYATVYAAYEQIVKDAGFTLEEQVHNCAGCDVLFMLVSVRYSMIMQPGSIGWTHNVKV